MAKLYNVDLGDDLTAYTVLHDDCVGEDQRLAQRMPSHLKPFAQGGADQAVRIVHSLATSVGHPR